MLLPFQTAPGGLPSTTVKTRNDAQVSVSGVRRWGCHCAQQCPGTLLVQPLKIRGLSGQQVAGETQGIDAEAGAVLAAAAHSEEPLVGEQQVVWVPRLGIVVGITEFEPACMLLVELLQLPGPCGGIGMLQPPSRFSPTDGVLPGPVGPVLLELLKHQRRQRTTGASS